MFKDGARYNSIGPWMKEYFGQRTAKLSLDGGFTCPNRDGKLSYDGCAFCSGNGSGDFAGDRRLSITEQMSAQAEFLYHKWNNCLYIAYFQNYTNTYASVDILRKKYEEALSYPDCCGIAIATRPDCINNDTLELLSELNQKTFLWVELGLQTSNDITAERINRCCSTAVYDDCADRLISHNIRVVTHVIFGLPGESHSDMINTVKHVCKKDIFGIKIHQLNIMADTAIGREYLTHTSDDIIPMDKNEYINTVADALEIIPKQITIHRLTGDAPPDLLIEPRWSCDKKSVLNGINMELKQRGTLQGIHAL
jgi:hypothetical protein